MYNHKDYKVCDKDGKSYSAYLMCADLKNNNNKFYVCQVLESISNSSTFFWTRYGRVGDQGVSEIVPICTAEGLKLFGKKLTEKTRKGYREIKMNLGAKVEVKDESTNSKDFAPSKLDSSVQDFVKLIYNKELMEQAVAANGYDVKKLPLGDLSKETIQQGYQALSEIEKVLSKKSTASL